MVATDMAATAIKPLGLTLDDVLQKGVASTAEQSAKSIIQHASKATIETTSGKFIDVIKDEPVPW